MGDIGYDRLGAIHYAHQWALGRNPAYLNFDDLGGDCTNFVSQCLYGGCGTMNYTAVYGWYYLSSSRRTASWTGVDYLYRFLTANRGPGPYGAEVGEDKVSPGDIVQLGDASGHFYHSPLIVGGKPGQWLVAAHSFDAWMRPLDTYERAKTRYLRIEGARAQG